MISILTFPIFAAALVYLAGRRDTARDLRLSGLLLTLCAVFPLLLVILPKVALLPADTEGSSREGFPLTGWLVAVWALGFLREITCVARAAVGLWHWRNQALEVDCLEGVAVCELAGLRSPVAAGVFRPVVFVPTSWRSWPEIHRRMVLEHELAHHRRRDPLWRLLAVTASALHWYNPLARWMTRRFLHQCEYACDAQVISKGFDPKTYARVLCDFATERSPLSLAAAMADFGSLESRVGHMLKPNTKPNRRAVTILALCGVLAACSLGIVGRKTQPIPASEIQLRLAANPFPGES